MGLTFGLESQLGDRFFCFNEHSSLPQILIFPFFFFLMEEPQGFSGVGSSYAYFHGVHSVCIAVSLGYLVALKERGDYGCGYRKSQQSR